MRTFFVLAQVRERRRVNLRNHHDVYQPERLRVVKRQHGLSLGNHVNSSAPAEDLVAVEIASHLIEGKCHDACCRLGPLARL